MQTAITAGIAVLALGLTMASALGCGNPEVPRLPPDAAICPGQVKLDIVRNSVGDSDSGQSERVILSACADRAVTEDERREGLRGAPSLPPGQALLIVWPLQLDNVCIVNDGVDFSIDALIIDDNGTVHAREAAIPADDGTPRCHDQVRWIAEFPAGQTDAVEIGDRVWPAPD